jgi:hypothetical protein
MGRLLLRMLAGKTSSALVLLPAWLGKSAASPQNNQQILWGVAQPPDGNHCR